MALLMPIVIKEVSIDASAGNTKNIIWRWASNARKDHGTRCVRLIAYIEHKLDLTRPDESRRKTRIKGITELSNILTG